METVGKSVQMEIASSGNCKY